MSNLAGNAFSSTAAMAAGAFGFLGLQVGRSKEDDDPQADSKGDDDTGVQDALLAMKGSRSCLSSASSVQQDAADCSL